MATARAFSCGCLNRPSTAARLQRKDSWRQFRSSRSPTSHVRKTNRPQASPDQVAVVFQNALSSLPAPHPGPAAGALATTAVFVSGWKVLRKGLTVEGILHAWFLGASIYSAFGPGGFLMVCLYFLFGTLVTKVKLEQKQKEGIAEARSGQRGPASVWGSGLAGTVCALLALATGRYDIFQIGFVSSFCSKLSDTVSSEIGKAYGKTTYLVTTFQLVPRGTEGAVSLEGTLAGITAAILFAGVAYVVGQVDVTSAGIVALSAIIANTAESYLGAIAQGKVEWLSNDVVNMLQISLAAAMAMAIKWQLGMQ